MKLQPKDLRYLYLNGGLAVALMLIGAGSVWYANAERSGAQIALKEAERRAQDIDRRLRQVNVEEKEILAKSIFFRALEQRRIIGPEQRLDWVELIDGIREQRRLFEIDYQISEQRTDGAPMGNLYVHASEMNFHLPLLHEGDLLGLIADLQERAPAIVQVRQCEITRATGKTDRLPGDPNLDARCTALWTTIGPAGRSRPAT